MSKVLDDALITIASRNIDKYRYNEDHNSDKEDGIEEALDTIRKITDSEYVSWVTYEDRKFSAISCLFHSEFKMLLQRLSKFNKVIIMSGTLALNGDFEDMILQWRLDLKEVMTRSLPTSFSYKQQAIIYVPKDLPQGRDNNQEYINTRQHHMKSLLKATEGRSLILSTCKKLMESFYNELLPFLSDMNITLLKQDNSGVETLTQAFKNDISSVLIGSGSFFSGFSVPGEALISVILTRLPFPVPDDPYLKLIGEGFDDVFFKVITFPNMMVKLNQAVGRLIRDIKDYGIITILDPRIFTMSYGSSIREIFEAMGYRITREFSDVMDFLNRVRNSQEDVIYPEYDKSKLAVTEALLYDEEMEKAKRESYRYTYSSFISRSDMANKKYKRLPEPEDDSTEKQWEFYHRIRNSLGLQYKKLDKLKTARHIYEYLIDLLSKKGMRTGMVEDDFPFANESQKVNFNRYNGKASPVKTYKLTADELARYK